MIDSSSVVSLITKTLSNDILKTSPSAKWVTIKQDKHLKPFSNEPIKVLEKLAVMVTNNDWPCKEACLTVVEDRHQLIIGRDFFNSIGLAVDQQAKSGSSTALGWQLINKQKVVNVLTILFLHVKLRRQSIRNFHL